MVTFTPDAIFAEYGVATDRIFGLAVTFYERFLDSEKSLK